MIKELYDKYKGRFFLIGILVFLIHFSKLDASIIGIDTESLIYGKGDFYTSWLEIGRQGLVFEKWLLDCLRFNPYFAGLMTLVVLGTAIFSFFMLWDTAFGNLHKENGLIDRIGWTMGALLWCSHPVITEQLYFSLQSMEVCIGVSLTAAALALILQWQKDYKKNFMMPVIAAVLLLITFSTYQSFVELFIFGAVSLALLNGISIIRDDNENAGALRLVKFALPYIIVFIISFVVNIIITNLFFAESSYLDEQIVWGELASYKKNIKLIIRQVSRVFTGKNSVHYDKTFGLLALLTVGLVFSQLYMYGRKKKKSGAVVLFFLLSLFASPFLIIILCGGTTAVRSQLSVPAIAAFVAYLDILICRDIFRSVGKKPMPQIVIFATFIVVCLCSAVGVWRQTMTTEALYYTEKMCYEQDIYITRELIVKIENEKGNDWLPVIFVGKREFRDNNSIIQGETIGHSFYEHDADVEPKYFFSSRRILGLMHILGYDYEQVTDPEQINIAVDNSKYMPAWPQGGCVQVHDGMVIVKVGELDE